MNLSTYDRRAFSAPFWKSDVMLHESVWPVGEGELTLPLLFTPDEIISVRSTSLEIEYQAGRDYLLRDGKLVLPVGTTIPVTPTEVYVSPNPQPNVHNPVGFLHRDGGYLYFGETDNIINRQIMVTYKHSDSWDGPLPQNVLNDLPLTQKRLAEKIPFLLGFWGDSITTGCNVTSFYNDPPYTEMWPIMTTEQLATLYDTKLLYVNKAVGGKATPWGYQQYHNYFGAIRPNLLFIAFGMNDASGKLTTEEYIANIERNIQVAREGNPDLEIILIATSLPNPDAVQFEGPHEEYEAPLMALAERLPGVTCLPLTSFHKAILEKKPYYHMTGNNINHPNDFLARIYTQFILASLYEF